MKKRFIVAVDSNIDKQNDSFIKFIKENGLGWWHWIDNFWLLVSANKDLNTTKIREAVNESFPGSYCLVIEFTGNPNDWSGFGPKTKDRDMFSWLHRNWK